MSSWEFFLLEVSTSGLYFRIFSLEFCLLTHTISSVGTVHSNLCCHKVIFYKSQCTDDFLCFGKNQRFHYLHSGLISVCIDWTKKTQRSRRASPDFVSQDDATGQIPRRAKIWEMKKKWNIFHQTALIISSRTSNLPHMWRWWIYLQHLPDI